MDGHHCCYLEPFRIMKAFLIVSPPGSSIQSWLVGWRGVGTGVAQHIRFTTGLGILMLRGHPWHRCSGRGGKKSQLQKQGQRQRQRQRGSSSTSPMEPLEAGRQNSEPQKEQHERQPGWKIRLSKPEQYKFPCEQQFKTWYSLLRSISQRI